MYMYVLVLLCVQRVVSEGRVDTAETTPLMSTANPTVSTLHVRAPCYCTATYVLAVASQMSIHGG